MHNLYSVIIDLIIIAVIAVCAVISSKQGFVKTLVEIVGFIAAFAIAFYISTPLAEFSYNKIIGPSVEKSITTTTEKTAEQGINGVFDSLPSFVKKCGVNADKINRSVNEKLSSGIKTAAKDTSNTFIKPLIVKVLGLLYSVLLIVVLLIVVKFSARFLNKIFSFSIIGSINRFLGGVLGGAKGVILALLFCMLVTLLLTFIPNGFLFFTKENIDKTYLFKLLVQFSPFN